MSASESVSSSSSAHSSGYDGGSESSSIISSDNRAAWVLEQSKAFSSELSDVAPRNRRIVRLSGIGGTKQVHGIPIYTFANTAKPVVAPLTVTLLHSDGFEPNKDLCWLNSSTSIGTPAVRGATSISERGPAYATFLLDGRAGVQFAVVPSNSDGAFYLHVIDNTHTLVAPVAPWSIILRIEW